jgi:hypothetical protein
VYEDTAEVVEFLAKCMPTQSPRFPASVDANGCLRSETKVEVV